MHQLDRQFNTSPLERICKNVVFNGCLLMVAIKPNHTVFRKLFDFIFTRICSNFLKRSSLVPDVSMKKDDTTINYIQI